MTAGGEHAGLHKRWLERKLEIEVGKVQAKLLSKGLSIPVPDPEALETEARLAQAHLPKLYIDLYGRNRNGTVKLSSDGNKRNGPLPPATVVQKLDRMMNPAMLTPIPIGVAVTHGLPLSCCDAGEMSTSGGGVTSRGGDVTSPGMGRASASHGKSVAYCSLGVGGAVVNGVAGGGVCVTEPGGSPRYSRSPPQPTHCRPDLQAADLRIDDAVAEVHRVALQANEMCPRERVLYLARQANPNFCLPQPRSVHLIATGGAPSRRDMLKKNCSRRATAVIPDPTADGGGGAGRGHKMQAGVSRRTLALVESRRSPDAMPGRSCSPGGGTTGDGPLPPLGGRSRPSSRVSSGRDPATMATEYAATGANIASMAASAANISAEHAAAAARVEFAEAIEALPRLSFSTSPAQLLHPSGEVGGDTQFRALSPLLPKLPPVHSGAEVVTGILRNGTLPVRTDSLIGLWGAAAIVHAAEMDAQAAAEAEALAEAEAEALAEAEAAAAAAAEAEAEAEAEAAQAALEADIGAEVQTAVELLEAQAMSSGGTAVRCSGEYERHHSGGDGEGRRSSAGSQGELHNSGHQHLGPGWQY